MLHSIDLHMHSNYSDDGEFTPTQLVERCAAGGIRIMSVTDHNTVRANEEAQWAAQKEGVHYIPGIEIDCVFQNINFHVLGYGIDHHAADFYRIEENVNSQSRKASLQMLEKTKAMGFDISEEDMREIAKNNVRTDSWTGEMFAEVLLNQAQYNTHPLLSPYRAGGARGDNPYVNFYWDFYSQGKPCYIKIEYPCFEETVQLIHKNGGKAVLAHPGVNLKAHHELLHPLVETGIDAVEAFSSYHTSSQASFFWKEAKKYHLFVTCGSDFHGKTKPSISLGQHGCSLTENEIASFIIS